jgi:hypothetical protein
MCFLQYVDTCAGCVNNTVSLLCCVSDVFLTGLPVCWLLLLDEGLTKVVMASEAVQVLQEVAVAVCAQHVWDALAINAPAECMEYLSGISSVGSTFQR